MHYRRLKFTGTLDAGKRSPAPLIDRFWRNIDKKSDNECWMWKAGVNSKGYGVLGEGGKGGKSLSAHRFSYELHHGEIPSNNVVMHICDNPSCVNPNHLTIGTSKDNTQDAVIKNRLKSVFISGENHILAKLNVSQVEYIKNNPDIKGNQLAKMFNVSTSTISNIRNNKRWKDVE